MGTRCRFLTPSLVPGSLEMKFSQFAVWNLLAGAVFLLSVGPAAYGAGKVSTGHHDPVSLGMLIGGIMVAAACIALVWHYYRRHKARRSGAGTPAEPTSPVHQSR
jgi:membrane protein DedA with SNARE-associated domain